MKKKNDLFEDVMDIGVAHVGLAGMTGAMSKLPATPQTGKIMGSMGMLNVPLKVGAMSVGFKQLQNLERQVKRRK